MYTTPAGQSVRRHPIRGFFWGLLMGVGITILLIVTNTVAIGTLTPVLVLVFSALFGIIWGLFAPPRKAKGQPAPEVEPLPAEEVEAEAAEAAAGAEISDEAVRATEAMSAEQTTASRETVIGPGRTTEHGGTVIDSPGGPEDPTDTTQETVEGASDDANAENNAEKGTGD